MANQDLNNYILSQEQKGVNPADIRKALIDAGWQAADVDAAFAATSMTGPSAPMTPDMTGGNGVAQDMYAGMQPNNPQAPTMNMGNQPQVSPMSAPTDPMMGAAQPGQWNPAQPDMMGTSPMPSMGAGVDPMAGMGAVAAEGGKTKKIVIIVGLVIGVLILVGGGYYLYQFYNSDSTENTNTTPTTNSSTTNTQNPKPQTNTTPRPTTNANTTPTTPTSNTNTTPTTPATNTNTVPTTPTTNTNTTPNVGTVTLPNTNTNTAPPVTNTSPDLSKIDTDGDGLSDQAEADYGTDPRRADTDGDGYRDKEEIENGYNPAGPGKL